MVSCIWDDAIVVSHVLGYKLFERNCGECAIGFPEEYLKKVTHNLSLYNIGFNIDNSVIKYPDSRYNECLRKDFRKKWTFYDFPFKSVTKDIIRGKFMIQYNEEEIMEKEIGVNINEDAPIVKFVVEHDVGGCYKYGDDIVKIISKNIEIDQVDILI